MLTGPVPKPQAVVKDIVSLECQPLGVDVLTRAKWTRPGRSPSQVAAPSSAPIGPSPTNVPGPKLLFESYRSIH